MSLKTRLLLLKVGYNLLSLAVIATILVVAYFHNKIIETSITMILFFIYRTMFEKQYHAKSLLLCSVISIIVFIIIINIELPISISILYSITITFIITLLSYYVRDYLDDKELIHKYRRKLESLNKTCIENLSQEELLKLMPDIDSDIILIVYGYLHKPKNIRADRYAYKSNVSERTLYRYVKLVKEKYESLQNL